MEKSINPNQNRVGTEGRRGQTFSGMTTNLDEAQEMASDTERSIQALRKFASENWRTIALACAGVSILAVGAFIYVNQQKQKTARELQH